MARPRRRAGAGGDELEAAFAVKVENLLTLYGWRYYHTHRSDRSPPGFPDYVAVRGPELIFAELKTERGHVRPAQAEWLEALEAFARGVWNLGEVVAEEIADGTYAGTVEAGEAPVVDVYLWRPSDLDAINARLSRDRHRLEYAG